MKLLRQWVCGGVLLLTSLAPASAAGWATRYSGGNNTPVSMKHDSAGNTYVLGTNDNGGADIVLLKYDTAGALAWAQRYAGTAGGNDTAVAMAISNSDEIFVVGNSYRGATNQQDILLLKYNSSGILQWKTAYNGSGNGDDSASGIALDDTGTPYVVGTVKRANNDIALLKSNGSGGWAWVRVFNGTSNGDDSGAGIAIDNGNNIAVTGSAWRGSLDMVTLHYGEDGTLHWTRYYNSSVGNSIDYGLAVAVTTGQDVCVVGSASNSTNQDYITVKYDNSGTVQWAKRYNGTGDSNDVATHVCVTADDSVFVTGYSQGATTQSDWATIRYNSSGVSQWTKRTRTGGNDEPSAFFVDSGYNAYVAGYVTGDTSGGTTGQDAYIVKYNGAGTPTFSARYNGSGNGDDVAKALDLYGGNIYIAVRTLGATDFDSVTIKY